MEKSKNIFQFPQKTTVQKKSRLEGALLLWRILQCQPELRNGKASIIKSIFFRAYKEKAELFAEISENLYKNIGELLNQTIRHEISDFSRFIMTVSGLYRTELIASKSPGKLLAFDIQFQVLQLVGMNPNKNSAEKIIKQMGKNEKDSSLSDADREMALQNFHASLYITTQILKYKTLKLALENRDNIIYNAKEKYPEVQFYFLESMFRYFISQVLLSRKYKCDTLIVEWMTEYGFGPEHMMRIARYIPYDSSFLHFRASYKKAIQSLSDYKPDGDQPEDSDEYLLRSLSNFYTSWLSRTALQIPV